MQLLRALQQTKTISLIITRSDIAVTYPD